MKSGIYHDMHNAVENVMYGYCNIRVHERPCHTAVWSQVLDNDNDNVNIAVYVTIMNIHRTI